MDIKIGRYRLTNKKAEKGDIIKTTKPETFYRTKAELITGERPLTLRKM
jgi:hypothetical protein